MKFQDLLNNISAEQTHGVCKRKFSTGFLSIDQSTALINEATFSYFENYAEKHDFVQKFQDLKSGVRLNNTENRAVTHFKYREPESDLYSKNLDEIDLLRWCNYRNNHYKNIYDYFKNKELLILNISYS